MRHFKKLTALLLAAALIAAMGSTASFAEDASEEEENTTTQEDTAAEEETTTEKTSGSEENILAVASSDTTDETTDDEDSDSGSEDETEDGTLTNYISSTVRTVSQDGEVLTYEVVDGIDTYTVSNKTGLTVSYTNSMNMTALAGSLVDNLKGNNETYWNALVMSEMVNNNMSYWEVLQALYEWIDDDTFIYLSYTFSDGVDLSSASLSELASSITLTSDMFSFSGIESDLSIDTDTNTLTITCHWDSAEAAAAMDKKSELDPLITITGIALPITSDWTVDDANGTTDADYLYITASGAVSGMMYGTVEMYGQTIMTVTASIDGGTAVDDEAFCLVLETGEEELGDSTDTTEEETTETDTADSPETGDVGCLVWIAVAAASLACIASGRKKILKG